MSLYWLKIGLGLIIVSLPFLFAAIQKKIAWSFFWSWTFASVFATLAFVLIYSAIQKNLDEQTKLIISIALGILFVGMGVYMRTIESAIVKKMGWLFIIFGCVWSLLSFRF